MERKKGRNTKENGKWYFHSSVPKVSGSCLQQKWPPARGDPVRSAESTELAHRGTCLTQTKGRHSCLTLSDLIDSWHFVHQSGLSVFPTNLNASTVLEDLSIPAAHTQPYGDLLPDFVVPIVVLSVHFHDTQDTERTFRKYECGFSHM